MPLWPLFWLSFRSRFSDLSQNELLVLMLVGVHDGISINQLVSMSSIPQPNVSRLLQALMLKDYVMRRERRRQYSHHLMPYARDQLHLLFVEAGHLLPDQVFDLLTGAPSKGPQA